MSIGPNKPSTRPILPTKKYQVRVQLYGIRVIQDSCNITLSIIKLYTWSMYDMSLSLWPYKSRYNGPTLMQMEVGASLDMWKNANTQKGPHNPKLLSSSTIMRITWNLIHKSVIYNNGGGDKALEFLQVGPPSKDKTWGPSIAN